MRALRRSPLFRIAVLSMAVLFAHTARATNVQRIIPSAPPCARKVAASQPDPDKKLSPAGKRILWPGHLPGYLQAGHNLFGGSLGFTTAHAASVLPAHGAVQIALARRTVHIAPQHSLFALRI
jgi:hypothetical protein